MHSVMSVSDCFLCYTCSIHSFFLSYLPVQERLPASIWSRWCSNELDSYYHTTMLACTPTATEEIYADVVKPLSMEEPHIVAIPTERPNIMYSIVGKRSLDEIADTVCSKLQSLSSPLFFFLKTIICRKYAYSLITYTHASLHSNVCTYQCMCIHA